MVWNGLRLLSRLSRIMVEGTEQHRLESLEYECFLVVCDPDSSQSGYHSRLPALSIGCPPAVDRGIRHSDQGHPYCPQLPSSLHDPAGVLLLEMEKHI